jgi:outer membrane immunogenic protein
VILIVCGTQVTVGAERLGYRFPLGCGEPFLSKAFLGSLALVALAAGHSAFAADMPVKALPYVTPAAAPGNWSGIYAGLNAGYGVANDRSTFASFVNSVIGFDNLESYKISPAGFLGGVQLGYNWQAGIWVWGLETDFQGTDQRDSVCVLTCDISGAFSGTVSQRLPWFGTARARVGVAVDRSLLYLTGGLAYGQVQTNIVEVDGPGLVTSISQNKTKTGWAIGGGIESALIGNWTAKVEYLYVDLGSQSFSFVDAAGAPGAITVTADAKDHIIRAGLNYHFGGPAGGIVPNLPAKAPYAVPPIWSWTGFYVGVNLGYGLGRDPTSYAMSSPFISQNESFKIMPSGVLGGGQLGYNWQFGRLVAGFESDIQATAMTDSACVFGCIRNTFFNLVGNVEQKLPWFGTSRGRLGYVGDSGAMFYLTGGVAYGETQTNIAHSQGSPPQFTINTNQTKTGWAFGGGVEVPVASRWKVKAEYLYVDLGSQTIAFTPQPLVNVGVASAFRENIFRVGANYAFSWGLPAAAVAGR